MLIEALVLDRHEGLRHIPRQRADGDARPHLLAELADHRAIAGQHQRRLRQRDDRRRVGALGGERSGQQHAGGEERDDMGAGHDANLFALMSGLTMAVAIPSMCPSLR